MYDFYTVQVGKNLYGYKHGTTPAELVMWSNLASGRISTTQKATPPTPRDYPSVTSYDDAFLFVIAGR